MRPEVAIPASEWGVVRVFAVNADAAEAARWQTDAARQDGTIAAALGAEIADMDHVEVLPTDPLKALGLSTYLIEGMGLPAAEVAKDRARLDALGGLVLTVTSPAFGGKPAVLRPGPELTLIGTYREPGPRPELAPIRSESARGTLSGGPAGTARGGAGGRSRGTLAALAALAVLALGLILWLR